MCRPTVGTHPTGSAGRWPAEDSPARLECANQQLAPTRPVAPAAGRRKIPRHGWNVPTKVGTHQIGGRSWNGMCRPTVGTHPTGSAGRWPAEDSPARLECANQQLAPTRPVVPAAGRRKIPRHGWNVPTKVGTHPTGSAGRWPAEDSPARLGCADQQSAPTRPVAPAAGRRKIPRHGWNVPTKVGTHQSRVRPRRRGPSPAHPSAPAG